LKSFSIKEIHEARLMSLEIYPSYQCVNHYLLMVSNHISQCFKAAKRVSIQKKKGGIMNAQASNAARNLELVREVPAPKKDVTVCTNPATCAVIAEYPMHTVEDVMTAVKNARRAQPAWRALPLKNKIRYVMKFAEYIQKNSDKLAEIISQDNGKTIFDAMFAEVGPATLATAYYCKNAAKFLKDRKLGMGNIMLMNKRSRIVRVPYGVVGIISPWNYPFAIPFSEVVMGLLAGNTVILKAASETQVVGHALKECIEYA
jgi:succinate-semialdehyde dehydrogenase/glutarate-semialdehyde dehydrogenase